MEVDVDVVSRREGGGEAGICWEMGKRDKQRREEVSVCLCRDKNARVN